MGKNGWRTEATSILSAVTPFSSPREASLRMDSSGSPALVMVVRMLSKGDFLPQSIV
jgi:hypothetical protein